MAILPVAGAFVIWQLNNRLEQQKEINTQPEIEWTKYKEAASSSESYLDVDYGIKIISSEEGEELVEPRWQ